MMGCSACPRVGCHSRSGSGRWRAVKLRLRPAPSAAIPMPPTPEREDEDEAVKEASRCRPIVVPELSGCSGPSAHGLAAAAAAVLFRGPYDRSDRNRLRWPVADKAPPAPPARCASASRSIETRESRDAVRTAPRRWWGGGDGP
jgi:hypothetical protein